MEARFELYADLFEIETDAMVAIARQRFSESISSHSSLFTPVLTSLFELGSRLERHPVTLDVDLVLSIVEKIDEQIPGAESEFFSGIDLVLCENGVLGIYAEEIYKP